LLRMYGEGYTARRLHTYATEYPKGRQSMKAYIEERAVEISHYIVANRATVRSAAQYYRISKSTVHKDVTRRIREVDPVLAAQVGEVLRHNMEERHIRGGMATRRKYAKISGDCP